MLKEIANKEAYLARGSSFKPLVLKQYLKKAIETQIKGNFFFRSKLFQLVQLIGKQMLKKLLRG